MFRASFTRRNSVDINKRSRQLGDTYTFCGSLNAKSVIGIPKFVKVSWKTFIMASSFHQFLCCFGACDIEEPQKDAPDDIQNLMLMANNKSSLLAKSKSYNTLKILSNGKTSKKKAHHQKWLSCPQENVRTDSSAVSSGPSLFSSGSITSSGSMGSLSSQELHGNRIGRSNWRQYCDLSNGPGLEERQIQAVKLKDFIQKVKTTRKYQSKDCGNDGNDQVKGRSKSLRISVSSHSPSLSSKSLPVSHCSSSPSLFVSPSPSISSTPLSPYSLSTLTPLPNSYTPSPMHMLPTVPTSDYSLKVDKTKLKPVKVNVDYFESVSTPPASARTESSNC